MVNDCSKYCDSTTMVTDGTNLSNAAISSQTATNNVLCTQCTSGCSLEASLSGGKLKKRKYKKSKKNKKTRKSKKNRKTKKNRKLKRKYKNNK